MRPWVVIAAVAALAVTAPNAPGAVTIGDTNGPVDGRAEGPGTYLQGQLVGSGYVIPTGGVITSWSDAISSMRELTVPVALVTARWTAPALYTVTGTSERVDEPASGGLGQHAHPARIPVAAGDVIGAWVGATPAAAGIATGSASAAYELTRYAADGATPPTPTLYLATGYTTRPATTLRLSAVVEPDADHDFYGDESQDACPANPLRQTAPCTVDGGIGLAASTRAPVVGRPVTLTATVTAPPDGSLTSATIKVTLPFDLSRSSVTGPCGGFGIVGCSFGNVAAGATATATIVAVARKAGPLSVSAVLQHGEPDPDPANDSATLALRSVMPPCLVPRLRGLTLAAAKQRLTRAGCRLGRVRRLQPRQGRLRVTRQTIAAGRRVARGTRVGVTLSPRRGSARARAAAGARRPARPRPR